MQGAIALLWVIYSLYLVQLLTQMGFSRGLALVLLVVENLLAMVVEPLMGTFSDQMQHQIGTRLPIISLGVVLAAGLFVVIPTTLVWGQGALRWGLPLLLVGWALAMAVFRSPALSLLGRYAMGTQLPQAASILTLVGGVSGAMGPLAGQFILDLGPFVAFTLGSVVLLVATLALRWANPKGGVASSVDGSAIAANPTSIPLPWAKLGLIFGTGVGVGLGFRLVMIALPVTLGQRVPEANTPLVLGALFIALALTAIPAGQLARHLGNRRAMVLGLSAMACLAILVGVISSTAVGVVLAALFGAALSLVSNGTLPFALDMVPPARAGLGTGTYFSGGALAASMGGGLFTNSPLTPSMISLVAALAFLAAGLCVGASGRLSQGAPSEA
ncbi:MAG: MFS transporter [Tildeniella torsiva UHER 1998/13D]|nr:MFS transporter [Tildeniella torsiva UHER 1998/13D]